MSFSDLEGKLSRHPSGFNRYCRNVASAATMSTLLLQRVVGPEQQPERRSAPPMTWPRFVIAEVGGGRLELPDLLNCGSEGNAAGVPAKEQPAGRLARAPTVAP